MSIIGRIVVIGVGAFITYHIGKSDGFVSGVTSTEEKFTAKIRERLDRNSEKITIYKEEYDKIQIGSDDDLRKSQIIKSEIDRLSNESKGIAQMLPLSQSTETGLLSLLALGLVIL